LHHPGGTGTFQEMAVTETGHLASRAIDDLYRQHGGEVYRYAYAVLGNHADAEDVTQTTFLNAYRALEQGVRPRKPSNWLLTIASNAIKQRFRQEHARPREVELDERIAGNETDDESPSVGELLTALSKIPPQQRQALVLREFEGRSYTEIAEILAVTTSALETLLFRARRSLAEELEHQLTCTDAQLAVSRSVDGRLGRKERRRLRDHLVECPDCASFARSQQRHRKALRGLMLIPIPLSLTMFKGLEGAGTATAATLPVGAGAGVVAIGAGVGTGVGTGVGATGAATGGGLLAGGVALKAAAVVAAVGVAGGVAVTGSSVTHDKKAKKPASTSSRPGQRLGQVAPRGVVVPGNGVARGKLGAPGQVRRTNTPAGSNAAKANTHRRNGLSHPASSSSSANSHAGGRWSHTRAAGPKKPAHAKSAPAKTTHAPQRKTGTSRASKPTNPTNAAATPTTAPPEQPTNQSAPSTEPTEPTDGSATATATETPAATETTPGNGNGKSGQQSSNGQGNGRTAP
jgi:RNA polymerase sigma factor (sigma-70 family)